MSDKMDACRSGRRRRCPQRRQNVCFSNDIRTG
jgi:hypothetical protein